MRRIAPGARSIAMDHLCPRRAARVKAARRLSPPASSPTRGFVPGRISGKVLRGRTSMYPNRRQMLGAITLPVASVACAPAAPLIRAGAARVPAPAGHPEDVARDEDYWAEIGRRFTIDRSVVNLNNGGVSPAPDFV